MKTCHIFFLIFQQSPLRSGIGGTGSGEQSHTQGLQERACVCALSNTSEGWACPHRSALWGNVYSRRPSRRHDLCQPSLIASGKMNQVNEDVLLKGWLLTQLNLAEGGLEGLGKQLLGCLLAEEGTGSGGR